MLLAAPMQVARAIRDVGHGACVTTSVSVQVEVHSYFEDDTKPEHGGRGRAICDVQFRFLCVAASCCMIVAPNYPVFGLHLQLPAWNARGPASPAARSTGNSRPRHSNHSWQQVRTCANCVLPYLEGRRPLLRIYLPCRSLYHAYCCILCLQAIINEL